MGSDDLFAQPCERRAPGLDVVAHHRKFRIQARQGRNGVQDVRLLERHPRGQPGGGRDGQVGAVRFHGAAAEDRGMKIRQPRDDRSPRVQSQALRDVGQQLSLHGSGGHQGWKQCGVAPGPGHKVVVVGRLRARPVVREPRQDHRRRRRRDPTRQAECEVVHRLEQDPAAAADVGQFVLKQQGMPGRVGAAGARRTAGHPNPWQGLVRGDAAHVEGTPDHRPRVSPCPGVGPQQDRPGGLTVVPHRHRRPPLPGDPDGMEPGRVSIRLGQRRRNGRAKCVVPLPGVLGRSAVQPDVDRDRSEARRLNLAVEPDHGNLGPSVAQVDRQDPVAHVTPLRGRLRASRPGRPT